MQNPPGDLPAESPSGSAVLPGVVLAVVLGGIHVLAFAPLSRRLPRALFWAAAAGFATLIWIFVQMIFIPFSVLQAVYVVLGLAESGLVMLLGLLGRRAWRGSAGGRPSGSAGGHDAAPPDQVTWARLARYGAGHGGNRDRVHR